MGAPGLKNFTSLPDSILEAEQYEAFCRKISRSQEGRCNNYIYIMHFILSNKITPFSNAVE